MSLKVKGVSNKRLELVNEILKYRANKEKDSTASLHTTDEKQQE